MPGGSPAPRRLQAPLAMRSPVPVFRSFDLAKAREFYVGFLGFRVDWEHRFEEAGPCYLQLSNGDCLLHLSEHYGDACPGATLRIELDAVDEFCAQLRAKKYGHARPGEPQETPWGTREIALSDPFGNRLIFYTRVSFRDWENQSP